MRWKPATWALSGGEPLMQARFAVKLFEAAKGTGIHTAIESNGYYADKLSADERALIDLVILDMKAISPGRHKQVTGMENNAPVLQCANRLASLNRPMWLRYVLVPHLTDNPDEMRSAAQFGASLGVVERVEILPFHQMGRYKWERLSKPYALAGMRPPSAAEVDRAVNVFRECGLKAAGKFWVETYR